MDKKTIVDRLYKAGYVSLEEVLVLMEKEVVQVPSPWYMPPLYSVPNVFPPFYVGDPLPTYPNTCKNG